MLKCLPHRLADAGHCGGGGGAEMFYVLRKLGIDECELGSSRFISFN